MKLTGSLRKELSDALAEAFPSAPALARMVSFGLDKELTEIAGGDTLPDLIFNLIKWAEAHDKIRDLIQAARTENPDNKRLESVARKFIAETKPATKPKPDSRSIFTGPATRRGRLREFLLANFSLDELETLAADLLGPAKDTLQYENPNTLCVALIAHLEHTAVLSCLLYDVMRLREAAIPLFGNWFLELRPRCPDISVAEVTAFGNYLSLEYRDITQLVEELATEAQIPTSAIVRLGTAPGSIHLLLALPQIGIERLQNFHASASNVVGKYPIIAIQTFEQLNARQQAKWWERLNHLEKKLPSRNGVQHSIDQLLKRFFGLLNSVSNLLPLSEGTSIRRSLILTLVGIIAVAIILFSCVIPRFLPNNFNDGPIQTAVAAITQTAVAHKQQLVPEIAQLRELGPFSQPPSVVAREGVVSVRIGGQILWAFGGTLINSQLPRSSTAAFGQLSNILMLNDHLDANGVPYQFLPFNEVENAYNNTNDLSDQYTLRPGSMVAINEEQALVFYLKVLIRNDLSSTPVGIGTARVRAGSTVAVRDPGLLFTPPDPLFNSSALVYGSYMYLYACEFTGSVPASCRIARAPFTHASERAAYEVWDGARWTTNFASATPILRMPTGPVSVAWNPYLGQFLAVYSELFSPRVLMATAPRPEGPWSDPVVAFTGLEPATGPSNVLATQHPALVTDGGRRVFVSYYHPLEGFNGETRLVEVTFR